MSWTTGLRAARSCGVRAAVHTQTRHVLLCGGSAVQLTWGVGGVHDHVVYGSSSGVFAKNSQNTALPLPPSSSSSQTSSFLALARAESTGWQLVITRNAFRNKTPYLRKFL